MFRDVFHPAWVRLPRCNASRSKVTASVAGVSACLILAVGCGTSGPPTSAVTGIVQLDGKPVPGATVTFSPSSDGGAFASGITNAEGRYALNAALAGAKAGAGTLPGEYRVSIVKIEVASTARTDDPNSSDYDPLASVSTKPPAPTYLVPKAYGDPATSGLSATVGQGNRSIDFDLKSIFTGK